MKETFDSLMALEEDVDRLYRRAEAAQAPGVDAVAFRTALGDALLSIGFARSLAQGDATATVR